MTRHIRNKKALSPFNKAGNLFACVLILVVSFAFQSVPFTEDSPKVSSHNQSLTVTVAAQLSFEADPAQDNDDCDKALIGILTTDYWSPYVSAVAALNPVLRTKAKQWFRAREPPYSL